MGNWSASTLSSWMHGAVVAMLAVTLVGNAWSRDGNTGIRVADSPPRIWTSSDGKFKVQARLIEITAAEVRLETAQGKSIKVDVARLSAEDNQFIESARGQAGGEDNSHMAPGAAESGAAPVTPARFAAGVGLRPSVADLPTIPLESSHMVSMSSGKWQKPPSRPVKSFQRYSGRPLFGERTCRDRPSRQTGSLEYRSPGAAIRRRESVSGMEAGTGSATRHGDRPGDDVRGRLV